MKKKTRIFGWAGVVLLVSLFLFFSGGCGKKTDQAKEHFELGVKYFEKQKAKEALQEFKQAIQLDPEYADAHFQLGALFHTLRAYDSATAEYKEVLRINPNYPRIHTALANVYYEIGLRAWGKAVKLDQLAYWEPDTLRQLPFKDRDELLGLIEGYQNKLKADTVDAETISKLSQANFLLAADEYQKAIGANSSDTTAQLYLGLTYSEQGYPAKAMAQHEILKKLDPRAGELLLTVLKQKEKEKEDLKKIRKEGI